ncbi:unnamed protein product [Rotaria socialis]
MENMGDLLIYLYRFFYLRPLKMKNENGSIKTFSVIISFSYVGPLIQCIQIQYKTNNTCRNYTCERALKIDF